jgi:hypothetical protein
VLHRNNPIRKGLVQLVHWKLFEWFALLVIIGNCVTLAMDRCDEDACTVRTHVSRV